MESPKFGEAYAASIRDLTQRLDPSYIDRLRTTAVGGGSVSLAIILVLTQVGLKTHELHVALVLASLAVPAWVGSWQFLESYILYGRSAQSHFNEFRGSGVALGLNVAGGILLFLSVAYLIGNLSHWACIAFVLTSIGVATLVAKQSIELRNLHRERQASES